MYYGHSNRDYLLPKGCKDLIDAIHLPFEIQAEVTTQKEGIIFRFKVSDLRDADADIVIEGRHLRIIEKSTDKVPRHKVLYVPIGYNLSKALTTYTEDEVRIFVPKC
jgi:hypothetical protein